MKCAHIFNLGVLRSIALRLASTVFVLLLSCEVMAKPTVAVYELFYEVDGTTADEIREQMSLRSPNREDGNVFDAHTEWYVDWRYDYNEGGGKCEVVAPNISVNVTFTMPRWIGRDSSAPALAKRWDDYYQALVAHEKGHGNNGISAALEIEQMVSALESESSCRSMDTKIDKMANKIIKKYNKADINFDKKTSHGMNEGAVFP